LANSTAYIFVAISVVAFLAVPFLPKPDQWVVPVEMERRRMSYLAISLASFAMMVFVGNRVEGAYPDQAVSRLLNRVDQFIFNDASTQNEEMLIGQAEDLPFSIAFAGGAIPLEEKSAMEMVEKGKKSTDPSFKLNKKAERKIEKAEKKAQKKAKRELRKKLFRMIAAGGTCALAVLLIILLLFPLCGGICLIIGGLSGDIAGVAIAGGIALAGLSIWGMIAAGKWCTKSRTSQTG
ncbi:MAG: hypothetical protein JNJ57_02285, partial [Saprospiraceae bacterium]|nr:hypothetical protein [Saprospiraceae bacterium]